MADILSPKERSERMRLVRSTNTAPEIIIRKMLSGCGYRYRLHAKHLPGRPDIVFATKMKIIFVHGCFWHRHPNCRLARLPKSKLDYWLPKLQANKRRDAQHRRALRKLGWQILVVWECQLSKPRQVAGKLQKFLADLNEDD